MSTLCDIEFENNPLKVCYSGKLLKGKVNIDFPVDTQIRAIYILFLGKGFCRWTESTNAKHSTGSKTYLDVRIDLLRSSTADVVIPAGNNCYPFQFHLPIKLPTSYEGTHGHIRYVAILHIDRAARKPNPIKEIFTVIRPLNLNKHTSFRMPMEVRKFTKFNQCCWFFCWKTAELKIFGRLPVSGYCPGQTVNLKLDVINNSYQEVEHFLVYFIKEVTYRSNNGSKKIETVPLTKRQTGGCRADRSGIQSIRINILVPSLPPTNFPTKNICGFRYKFRVIALTGCCHRDPMFEIPVIIGTYPISDELYLASVDNTDNENHSSSLVLPYFPNPPTLEAYGNTSNSSLNSSQLPPYPDSDPPTYEEAMHCSEMLTEDEHFIPIYPSYKRATTYANEDFN